MKPFDLGALEGGKVSNQMCAVIMTSPNPNKGIKMHVFFKKKVVCLVRAISVNNKYKTCFLKTHMSKHKRLESTLVKHTHTHKPLTLWQHLLPDVMFVSPAEVFVCVCVRACVLAAQVFSCAQKPSPTRHLLFQPHSVVMNHTGDTLSH